MQSAPSTAVSDATPVRAGEHLVITVHGVCRYGDWQKRLGTMLREREPGIVTYHYQARTDALLALLGGPLRGLAVYRFRRWLLRTLNDHPNARRVDLVAHGAGTQVAAAALRGIPARERPSLHTVLLAGSTLPESFPWGELLGDGTVQRVVNECGVWDWALLVYRLFVPHTGLSGTRGFVGGTSGRFLNRYFPFGHGGFFRRDGRGDYNLFMRSRWLPLLTDEAPAPPIDHRTPLGRWALRRDALLEVAAQSKRMAWTALLLALAAWAGSRWLAPRDLVPEWVADDIPERPLVQAGFHLRTRHPDPAALQRQREQSHRRRERATQRLAAESDKLSAVETAAASARVGQIHALLGHAAEAEQAYRRAVELYAALAERDRAEPEHRRELAGACRALGELLRCRGDGAAAELMCRRALALFEQLARAYPDEPAFRVERSRAALALTHALSAAPHRPPEVRAEALDLARRAVEQSPADPSAWQALGAAQLRSGDARACVRDLRKAMGLRGSIAPEDALYLTLAYDRLGAPGLARSWFDWAARYLQRPVAMADTPIALRAEAADRLGLVPVTATASASTPTP